jgi:hypothetical protein
MTDTYEDERDEATEDDLLDEEHDGLEEDEGEGEEALEEEE